MWDVIAQVPEKPGHFDPIGFFGVHMTTDNLSDVYVTYTATRPTPGGGVGNDTFLTKLLSSGGQGVTDNLDSPVSAIAVDGPHNIYIAQTVVIEDRTTDVVITQYDPFFNLLKTATFGGTRDDLVSALAVDPNQSGRVYLAGHTESNDFGGSRGDALTDIGLDFAGNVYVAGSTNSPDLPTAHGLQACSPHPTVKNTMLASDCIQDTI